MFMKKASIISLLASLFFSCHADTERVLEPVDFKQAIQNDSTARITVSGCTENRILRPAGLPFFSS